MFQPELSPAEVEALVAGRHGDAGSRLGLHPLAPGRGWVVRVLRPGAARVAVWDWSARRLLGQCRTLHPAGLFELPLPRRRRPFAYRLQVDGGPLEADAYAFGPFLPPEFLWWFSEGTAERPEEWLGAHPREVDGVTGTLFALWAPHALRASVVGDWNQWDGRVHPMRRRGDSGVFELFVPGVGAGALYKYELLDGEGRLLPLKADPYGRAMEHPPASASRVVEEVAFPWRDAAWLEARARSDPRRCPVAIYEVHAGSWRRAGERRLGYAELAEQLVPYVAEMGFTHVEFLPLAEHPFDGSWGYQPLGLYAPTARYGPPEGLKALVDAFHAAGIGVLFDWVPAHFPADPHGLSRFDGTALYECEDPRRGWHPHWHTLIYDYGRPQVRSFLLGNARYWLEEFHADGLRVDAVSSMLYLDYGRGPGEWLPNPFGGRENLDAVDFLRALNERLAARFPGALIAAEESTAWPGVTRPVAEGGLGFRFKWNLGWMNDTLRYMARDPIHRRFHHEEITFGILYAASEAFILPLSHDEVVHGKGSLLAKMPGDRWRRFANLRAYYGMMWAWPGKKLLFMGGEFAQEGEWRHEHALDWHLLADSRHAGVQRLVRDLNQLYRSEPALHELDCDPAGFEWVQVDRRELSVFAWLRRGAGGRTALAVSNLTPVPRFDYRVGVPAGGYWRERINTDAREYGGSGLGNLGGMVAEAAPWDGRPFSLSLVLPPLATLIFTGPE